jgi:hypothetical protein
MNTCRICNSLRLILSKIYHSIYVDGKKYTRIYKAYICEDCGREQ